MEIFSNRHVRLILLTLGLGLLLWAVIWSILSVVGLRDFPVGLQVALAFLGSGLLVYKVFSNRVF